MNSRKANGLFGAGEQPLPAGGGDHQRKLQCKGENRNSVPLKLTEGRLEKRLGHGFRDSSLLIQAFCHASYVNEHPESGLKNNERLEFLGDAVLDLAVSTLLMEIFPDSPEGELSKFRAMVVDEAGLYEVALGLGLGEYLLLGRGEDQGSGREKPSILADALEALVGAIYLDDGFETAMEVIARLFQPMIARVGAQEMVHDFKSLLQEFTQQAWKTLPKYRLVDESGPPHQKTFTVALDLRGKMISQGEGGSKKEAEQNAARQAFFSLKET